MAATVSLPTRPPTHYPPHGETPTPTQAQTNPAQNPTRLTPPPTPSCAAHPRPFHPPTRIRPHHRRGVGPRPTTPARSPRVTSRTSDGPERFSPAPGWPSGSPTCSAPPSKRVSGSCPQAPPNSSNTPPAPPLSTALNLALHSIGSQRPTAAPRPPRNRLHRVLAGASGAVGGAFGLGALAFELPFSTTLILRSIARIAASQGHDLSDVRTRLACLEVFALGGQTTADQAAETSYWAVRAALARVVGEAAGSLAGRAATTQSTPAAVQLVTTLASRFGVVVSEQVAAKAVPIVGAAAGAAINVVFMDHFQKMAEGHFILRRLEHQHGTDAIRHAYESLSTPLPHS
jgi:hypothetical protein